MIRGLNIVLMVTCVLSLVGVYGLKFQSEGIAGEKAALGRQIAQQKQDLSLLKADWAVLNQPGHLAPIIARHADTLQLAVIVPEQFKSFDDLPMRPAAPDAEALTTLLMALEAGVDPIAALIEANAQ